MKTFNILFALFFISLSYSQVGIGTTTPNAQLDITSTTRGVLIPKVSLTSLTVQLPVINPQGGSLAESTLVYHDGTNGINAGYYYWNVTFWSRLGRETENFGLQYYAYDISGSSPNMERLQLGIPYGSGLHTGNLNDASHLILRGSRTDNYIIHFTGTLIVNTAGSYQLQAITDDGARILIDDKLVLNQWVDQATSTINSATMNLAKGKHKIEFWYYERTGGQEMTFNWLQNANGGTLPRTVTGTDFIIE